MYVPSIHLHVILSGSYFFWSFFLSGLRRHLCICPLRAPTDTNAFFHYLPASLFPFPSCFTSIVEEPYLSKKKINLSWTLFCIMSHVRTCRRASTYYIVVPQAQYSAISPHKAANQVRADQSATTQASRELLLYCSTASTAQHSAISLHQAAKQVRADQCMTTLASRQSWREPAHDVEHL